ncbi:unnamed protein product [Chilo suppressalis]|uniref:Uncharacterized protein n=1 Tax=Chilo suppressalis TaxID=168631 RepID=A0ABN8BAB8_CHISP|nr:unnamed protein product [Chilo suppressalis]
MFSKFLRATAALKWGLKSRQSQSAKQFSGLIPPNQYDSPIPKRLHLGYVLKEYWETIPLFVTTCAAMCVLFGSIAWACAHKVDVVFTTHNRDSLSRTMDLRNPTINKLVIINQRYEPWPEMQDLLDKMKNAEKRALLRAQSCNQP